MYAYHPTSARVQITKEVEEFAYLKSKCGQAIKQPTKGWSHRQLHRGAVPKAGHHEAPKLYEGDWYINVRTSNTTLIDSK